MCFHRHFIGKCRGVANSLRRKAGQQRNGTRRSGERQLLKQRPGRFGLIAAAVDRGSEERSRFPPGEAGDTIPVVQPGLGTLGQVNNRREILHVSPDDLPVIDIQSSIRPTFREEMPDETAVAVWIL